MATKGIGRLIQAGIAKETTRGTAVGSASYWTPWNDLTLDEKKEFATDAQAYGIIEDSVNMTQTKKWSQGSLQGNFLDQSSGLVLYSMFGSHAVTGSGPYVHTFTVGESAQHQSLTFFLHDPLSGVDYSYANGVVEKLEIDIALKKFITFDATIKALSGASQSAFTPSTTSDNRFLPQYLVANFAPSLAGVQGTLTGTGTCSTTTAVTGLSISTTLLRVGMTVTGSNIPANTTIVAIVSASAFTLSQASTGSATSYTFGPAVVALKSAKITINSNVEEQDVIGSLNPADFLNKEFSIEGSLEAIWQNESDFKTAFMGPTAQAISFVATNTDVTINGSSHPILNITLAQCTFQELGRPFKVKDLIYQTVKFKAVYNVASALLGEVILTNSVSTY
jgi:Phage tail tube protein